jgi:hypothetical protein
MLKPPPKPKNRNLTPSRHPNEDNATDPMHVKNSAVFLGLP